jgi:MFS family permease
MHRLLQFLRQALRQSYANAFAVREFNKLWAGQTISLVGSALTVFALPSLAVLLLHATPAQVGTLSALQILPFPLLGLFVGVVADRVSRRRMMIVADLVRFAALAAIPAFAFYHHVGMALLYVVALVTGTASVFFGVAYQSYLPAVVGKEMLTVANARLEFSNSGSEMVGNALGGILVQWIGAVSAIAIDAVSYLASVAALSVMRVREEPHQGPNLTLRQGSRELREGLHVVLESPDLRWIAGSTATMNLGLAFIGAVIFIYAYRQLHLQPGPLGVIWGIAELGFVGALLAVRVRAKLGLRFTLIAMGVIGGVSSAVLLFAQSGVPYLVFFVSAAIFNLTVPIYNVNQISYRQALVDERLQGRMNATMRTIVWGTMPLGAWIGGWLGTLLGITTTIAIGSVITACASLWLIPLRERSV